MATSFSKMGVLGLFLFFLAIHGTSTWARQLNGEEGIIEMVSNAEISSNGGVSEVPGWVTTIYKPESLGVECGVGGSACTKSLGFYDTCCTSLGFYCSSAIVGVCLRNT